MMNVKKPALKAPKIPNKPKKPKVPEKPLEIIKINCNIKDIFYDAFKKNNFKNLSLQKILDSFHINPKKCTVIYASSFEVDYSYKNDNFDKQTKNYKQKIKTYHKKLQKYNYELQHYKNVLMPEYLKSLDIYNLEKQKIQKNKLLEDISKIENKLNNTI